MASGLNRELPGDGGAFGVTGVGPSRDFVLQLFLTRDTTVEALLAQC